MSNELKAIADAGGINIVPASRAAASSPAWFDRVQWEARGARRHTSTGRAPVLIGLAWDDGQPASELQSAQARESWVLRHYSRGGMVARFIEDHYVWQGIERTRAWREMALLQQMQTWNLPAPAPVAARVVRGGFAYRADIITVFIPQTRALSALLRTEAVGDELWARIGTMVGEFHAFGIDHRDITAHNILVDERHEPFLVDFDNARVRARGKWCRRGLLRFERSLRKVAMETGTQFSARHWQIVTAAYDATSRR